MGIKNEIMRLTANLKLLIFILLLFFSGGSCFAADTPSAEELYFEANRAYKEDRYPEAIDGYLELIGQGYVNGHLYYNLGNAYFRAGQLGRAILNYKRAQLLIPRDADLNFNLRYALDQTQDAIAADQNFLNQAFFWLDDITFRELMWGFAVLNILFWGILVLRLFVRPEWTYYVFIVLLIFWLVGGVVSGGEMAPAENRSARRHFSRGGRCPGRSGFQRYRAFQTPRGDNHSPGES